MRWSQVTRRYGNMGGLRVRYATLPGGGVRLFLLEPETRDYLRLVYTRVYDTLDAGVACILADYEAARSIAPDGCQECGGALPPNPRAKFCGDFCRKKAGKRGYYQRRKQGAANVSNREDSR